MKNINIYIIVKMYIYTHYIYGTQQITTKFDFLKIYGKIYALRFLFI